MDRKSEEEHLLINGPLTIDYGGKLIFVRLRQAEKAKLPNMRLITFLGEPFSAKYLNQWIKSFPHVHFANIYGPTEITNICCCYDVEHEINLTSSVPIGRACNNKEVFLLSDDNIRLSQKDIGKIGEICVRGTGVGCGYWNDFIKTDKSFKQNPTHNLYRDIMYCTGDLGAYDADGNIILHGRKDDQVKILGHRVELGEIERVAESMEGVQRVKCIYKNNLLKIFYEAKKELEILNYLKSKLPSYMIPRKAILLDHLPLNQNNKIDKKALEKFLYDSAIAFEFMQPGVSTNINESFHSLKAELAPKDKCWKYSFVLRMCCAILAFNEGPGWKKILASKMNIPLPQKPSCVQGIEAYEKRNEKYRVIRSAPTYPRQRAIQRKKHKEQKLSTENHQCHKDNNELEAPEQLSYKRVKKRNIWPRINEISGSWKPKTFFAEGSSPIIDEYMKKNNSTSK